MERILDIREVTKYYANANVVTKALDCISLRVMRGEFTAIMGASGSGKSTLLNLISTIDRVSAGEIFVDGLCITNQKEDRLAALRRDRLGFIFQDYNLLDTLTVAENITLPLSLRRENIRTAQEKLRCIAETFGITQILSAFPNQLSGGQRQRAACARAVITQPALVLADEPTGALDSANSRILMQTFQQMNAGFGATILMVTHDARIASYAQRTLFLKDGRLFSEILRGDRTRKAFYEEILAVITGLGGEGDVD